jgi:hypothetical protein
VQHNLIFFCFLLAVFSFSLLVGCFFVRFLGFCFDVVDLNTLVASISPSSSVHQRSQERDGLHEFDRRCQQFRQLIAIAETGSETGSGSHTSEAASDGGVSETTSAAVGKMTDYARPPFINLICVSFFSHYFYFIVHCYYFFDAVDSFFYCYSNSSSVYSLPRP